MSHKNSTIKPINDYDHFLPVKQHYFETRIFVNFASFKRFCESITGKKVVSLLIANALSLEETSTILFKKDFTHKKKYDLHKIYQDERIGYFLLINK